MPGPKIVCHRGACLTAPENTLASAEAALRLGGAVIELDIRQSRDGVLYVLHDATLDRTTDGTGPIADWESADIDRLDAGAWFDPAFAGERVPRLETYLAALKDRAGFYLENKSADPAAIGAIIRRLGIAEQCFTFSFDPALRAGIAEHAPEIRAMIHWSTAGSVAAAKERHGASIVEFHSHDLDPAAVAACQEAGLTTMLFTPKPDTALFALAIRENLDMVNIDHIALFEETRASLAA